MAKKFVFAANTCVASTGSGRLVRLREGEAWDADDPFVRERPELFEDEPKPKRLRRTTRFVERATAAPGEKRSR